MPNTSFIAKSTSANRLSEKNGTNSETNRTSEATEQDHALSGNNRRNPCRCWSWRLLPNTRTLNPAGIRHPGEHFRRQTHMFARDTSKLRFQPVYTLHQAGNQCHGHLDKLRDTGPYSYIQFNSKWYPAHVQLRLRRHPGKPTIHVHLHSSRHVSLLLQLPHLDAGNSSRLVLSIETGLLAIPFPFFGYLSLYCLRWQKFDFEIQSRKSSPYPRKALRLTAQA